MSDPIAAIFAPATAGSSPRVTPVVLALDAAVISFGGRQVLGPLTLQLDAGAVAIVHGANGAGKTTLLRLAAGLLAPSGGTRTCSGRAVYLRPGSGARHAVTVRQAVQQVTALAGGSADTVALACRAAGLSREVCDRPVGDLSAGEHARLGVALAVAARPALACLDEPSAHLDPDGVERVCGAVSTLAGAGTSVLLASHAPELFTGVADATLAIELGCVRAVTS